ncbi:hypothetical protein BaRGS_00032708, partial [Batillaria attramentaria]
RYRVYLTSADVKQRERYRQTDIYHFPLRAEVAASILTGKCGTAFRSFSSASPTGRHNQVVFLSYSGDIVNGSKCGIMTAALLTAACAPRSRNPSSESQSAGLLFSRRNETLEK